VIRDALQLILDTPWTLLLRPGMRGGGSLATHAHTLDS
jgi:hypothetical protein